MFDKKMKLIGVSILVCLAAIVAVPAFAAGSTHQGFQKNGVNPPVMNATMEIKLLGFAEAQVASLQQKGVDVTDLNAALANAKIAIQNADATAFRDAMKTFRQDIPAGIRNGSIDKSVLPQPEQRPAPALGTRIHPFTPTKNHGNSTGSAPRV